MRIGIDLGGTKIEGVALDDSGRILIRQRVATPAGDYRATLEAIGGLVAHIEGACGSGGSIGIATPGSLSPTRDVIRNANSICLNGQALGRDLQALLGQPVRLANDADCFALSEAIDGAARGAANVFGVILGTGTGGGIVIGGKLVTGPNAIAGEWGHNPLPWPQPDELPGPNCYCGKQGCIETFLSGPGLTRGYQQAGGEERTPLEIAASAKLGERLAMTTLDRYENRLARSLASIINVLDPEVIVLGGGLSNLPRLYRNVPRIWSRYVFSDHVGTKLVAPVHGDSSGVRGAAWLWSAGCPSHTGTHELESQRERETRQTRS